MASRIRGGFPFVVALMLSITLATRPTVAESIVESKSPDDVWMISSRAATESLRSTEDTEGDELFYWHDTGDSDWVASSREEFLTTGDIGCPTIFYVHGNRLSAHEALPHGLQVFKRLFGGSTRKPVRYVIWSWPSTRVKGQLKDLRIKAYRSETHAYHLAQIVDEMQDDLPVGFVGYSYGARLITAALHLLGGGEVTGRRLSSGAAHRQLHMRAVLVAAALDNDWLLPGHNHGFALTQLERMLVVVNTRDPALRLYPLLKRGPMPDALGLTGLPRDRHADYNLAQVDELDVSGSVGKAHALKNYFNARKLMSRIGPFLTFPDVQRRQPADG